MKGIRSLLTAAGLALALTATATAQDYPNKPVRIVVPFAPGGINDVAARLLAQHLSEKLGKQFIAENMPGGGGISATERVIHAAPDGYNILILSIANAVHPAMYTLKYDLLKASSRSRWWSPAQHAGGASRSAGQDSEGVHRARQGEARRHSICLGRHRRLAPSRHGEFQGCRQDRLAARAVQGAGTGTIDVIAGNTKAVMSTLSSVSGHLKNEKLRGLGITLPSASKRFPTSRPSSKPAFRNTKAATGSASASRPAHRRQSSTS